MAVVFAAALPDLAAYHIRVRAYAAVTPTSLVWLATVTCRLLFGAGLVGFQVAGAPRHCMSDGTWKLPPVPIVVFAIAHGTHLSSIALACVLPVSW